MHIEDLLEQIYLKTHYKIFKKGKMIGTFHIGEGLEADLGIIDFSVYNIKTNKYNDDNDVSVTHKELNNSFEDMLNPTQQECTMFELTYGYPWLIKPNEEFDK